MGKNTTIKRVHIDSLKMNDDELAEYVKNLDVLPFSGIHFDDKETCDIMVVHFENGNERHIIKKAFEYLKQVEL